MVTVSNYFVRQTQEGKSFVVLELTGDLELIQSSTTGGFYASVKKCTIPSTFTEDIAKMMIGKQLPGKIERVQCETYSYTVKETGEVIELAHTYAYNPSEKEETSMPKPANALVSA
jgi:hypothetical protein